MDIYHFHPKTGEFLGQGVADRSPLEPDVWGVPAFATDSAPPAEKAGKARVWANGAWTQVPNHRGETWWDSNGEPIEVDEIGDPADQGLIDQEPPAPPAYPTAEAALLAMVAWIEQLHASITGPVPQDVKHGWKAKADWARAWNTDNSIAVPQIYTDEMTVAGTAKYPSVQSFVDRVIAKADIYEGVVADTEGLRTKTQDLIEAEAAKATPDPHQYEVILQAAQAEAVQLADLRGITLAA